MGNSEFHHTCCQTASVEDETHISQVSQTPAFVGVWPVIPVIVEGEVGREGPCCYTPDTVHHEDGRQENFVAQVPAFPGRLLREAREGTCCILGSAEDPPAVVRQSPAFPAAFPQRENSAACRDACCQSQSADVTEDTSVAKQFVEPEPAFVGFTSAEWELQLPEERERFEDSVTQKDEPQMELRKNKAPESSRQQVAQSAQEVEIDEDRNAELEHVIELLVQRGREDVLTANMQLHEIDNRLKVLHESKESLNAIGPLEGPIRVAAIGSCGISELSKHLPNNTMSWALLRLICGSHAVIRSVWVTITCLGSETPSILRARMTARSAEVLNHLGHADVSLGFTSAKEVTPVTVFKAVLSDIIANHGMYTLEQLIEENEKATRATKVRRRLRSLCTKTREFLARSIVNASDEEDEEDDPAHVDDAAAEEESQKLGERVQPAPVTLTESAVPCDGSSENCCPTSGPSEEALQTEEEAQEIEEDEAAWFASAAQLDQLLQQQMSDKQAPSNPGPPQHTTSAALVFCPSCGNEYMPDSVFCRKCGVRREVTEEEVMPAPVVPTESARVSLDTVLSAVARPGVFNWAILEPVELALHNAGCGGFEEMKEWFEPSKVMFGIVCVSLGGGICNHVFVHWIGPEAPIVRMGQWNCKVGVAQERIRCFTSIDHTIIANSTEDLVLATMMKELKLAMSDAASSAGAASVPADFPVEEIQVRQVMADLARAQWAASGREEEMKEIPEEEIDVEDDPEEDAANACIPDFCEVLADVRKSDGQWNWVLMKLSPEGGIEVSAGSGGIADLRKNLPNDRISFALLRVSFSSKTFSTWVRIVCLGGETPAALRETLAARLTKGLKKLGPAGVALELNHAEACTRDSVLEVVLSRICVDDATCNIEQLTAEYEQCVRATKMKRRLRRLLAKTRAFMVLSSSKSTDEDREVAPAPESCTQSTRMSTKESSEYVEPSLEKALAKQPEAAPTTASPWMSGDFSPHVILTTMFKALLREDSAEHPASGSELVDPLSAETTEEILNKQHEDAPTSVLPRENAELNSEHIDPTSASSAEAWFSPASASPAKSATLCSDSPERTDHNCAPTGEVLEQEEGASPAAGPCAHSYEDAHHTSAPEEDILEKARATVAKAGQVLENMSHLIQPGVALTAESASPASAPPTERGRGAGGEGVGEGREAPPDAGPRFGGASHSAREARDTQSGAAGCLPAASVRLEMVLAAVAGPGLFNWAILEPKKLDLHNAGCGGFEEMKDWFDPTKVMFGAIRLSLGAGSNKHVFVHWIGPKASPGKRGLWNSKVNLAEERIRGFMSINHTITAYCIKDLDLVSMMKELKLATSEVDECDIVSALADFQAEELHLRQVMADLTLARSVASTGEESVIPEEEIDIQDDPQEDTACNHIPDLCEALTDVRKLDGQWNWVLVKIASGAGPKTLQRPGELLSPEASSTERRPPWTSPRQVVTGKGLWRSPTRDERGRKSTHASPSSAMDNPARGSSSGSTRVSNYLDSPPNGGSESIFTHGGSSYGLYSPHANRKFYPNRVFHDEEETVFL